MNQPNQGYNDALLLYKAMFTMRLFEERIAEIYPLGLIRTPVHLGIGQEAIAAGVLNNKIPGDIIFSHHRCHNHFIGAGGNLGKLAAELLGKCDGVAGGRGGSVHLVDREVGFMGSSAIMGESVTLATGAAFAIKKQKSNNVAFAFFGDGALDEGAIWESANFAAVHSLPILFVCENNFYSAETTLDHRKKDSTQFVDRFSAFGIESEKLDGNNVMKLDQTVKEILNNMRINPAPFFLECSTYRWKEHVGPYEDSFKNRSYRNEIELTNWKKKCPINNLKVALNKEFNLESGNLNEMEADCRAKIDEAFQFADKSAFPELGKLNMHVYRN